MTDIAKLSAPFPPDRVSWRVGATNKDRNKGLALAYIDARDVMARLDEVCGPAGWQNDYPHANGKTVCRIGILCDKEWIWKANGAGDTDVEAEKGALSDAFKRAAVMWGIGRYLYDVSSPWVEIEAAGKSVRIKDSELPKLQRLLQVGGPAPAGNTTAFMVECRAAIDAFTDWSALGKWWNSDEQRQVRRDVGLSSDGVAMLKSHVLDRIEALKKGKAA